jgi:diaminopimelate epimerase
MRVDFIKMHGAGNDFVILDERARPLEIDADQVRRIADRRLGVGCDQLVRLRPATEAAAGALMIIHNADGSMSSTCGNATRCVAVLLADDEPGEVVIETLAGLLSARVLPSGDVSVDMGRPGLDGRSLGLSDPSADTLHLDLPGDPAGCSMGNPHATLFVAALDAVDVAARGAALGSDALFADGANVGFAQVLDGERIRLRVFERGAGLTPACGSGACAALVNAHRRGLTGRRAALLLDGGTLGIEWREADDHVLMTGPAETAFTGRLEL